MAIVGVHAGKAPVKRMKAQSRQIGNGWTVVWEPGEDGFKEGASFTMLEMKLMLENEGVKFGTLLRNSKSGRIFMVVRYNGALRLRSKSGRIYEIKQDGPGRAMLSLISY